MRTRAAYLLLTTLTLLATAGPVAAQFRYYSTGSPAYGYRTPSYGYYNGAGYNPWGNGAYWGGDQYGGYLNGAANVINAQGQYLINNQKAYLEKENVRSAMMDNRRKAFDEILYEKANTPTLNETRLKDQQDELRRAMTNPPETEIWSGKSLNDLLMNAQQMQARGLEGPTVPLNPHTLKDINVTVKDVGNVGLLKDAGKLKWPYALRSMEPRSAAMAIRDQIDQQMIEGKKQAGTGQVDADLLTELDRNIDKLRIMLKDVVAQTSFNDYTSAKRYLSELDGAVKVLKQPDVDKYVTGHYAAQGRTAAELVSYMSQNGLRFSPATAGEEGAYSGLFQSLLQYTYGTNAMVANPSSPPSFLPPKK